MHRTDGERFGVNLANASLDEAKGELKMYINHFESILFQGQRRIIITSFPVRDKSKLEALANEDNNYPVEKGWKLVLIHVQHDEV